MKALAVAVWVALAGVVVGNVLAWRKSAALRAEADAFEELLASTTPVSPPEVPGAGRSPDSPRLAPFEHAIATGGLGGGEKLLRLLEASALSQAELESLVKSADARKGTEEDRAVLFEALLLELADHDPALAVKLAVERGAKSSVLYALRLWGESDPDAALTWFHEVEGRGVWDPDERFDPLRSGFNSLMAGIMSHDPGRAFSLLRDENPEDLVRILSGLAPTVEADMVETFARQVSSLEDGGVRMKISQAVGATLAAANNIAEATEFIDNLEDISDDERAQLATTAVQNIPFDQIESPETVADFLAGQVGASEESLHGIAWFITRWTHRDFDGVARWLQAQNPSETWRDGAVATFSKEITEADPMSASDWAATIGDPDLRSQSLTDIFTKWSADDQASATAYFLENGLEIPATGR